MCNERGDFEDPLTLGEAVALCMIYAASGGFVVGIGYAVFGWFF